MSNSKLPWYHTAFRGDYLDRYAHRDDDEARRAVRRLVEPLGLKSGALTLDLACGAGRHALELDRMGLRVVGGDLSLPLLQKASEEFAEEGKKFPAVRLNMCCLPFPAASFDLVVNFFTAFGYFDSDEENYQVFSEIARVLRPGGSFIFDFLNGYRVASELSRDPSTAIEDRAGEKWETTKRLSDDGLRALKKSVPSSDPEAAIYESVRLFKARELLEAVEARGLVPEKTFGNYDGAPFDRDSSSRFILVCNRSN